MIEQVQADLPQHPDNMLLHVSRWAEVWQILKELQSGTWSSLPISEALAELCRALLRCGNWRLAQKYLRRSDLLPSKTAEQIVVAAGREYFHSANSHDAPEIKQVLYPGIRHAGWHQG